MIKERRNRGKGEDEKERGPKPGKTSYLAYRGKKRGNGRLPYLRKRRRVRRRGRDKRREIISTESPTLRKKRIDSSAGRPEKRKK